MKLVPLTALADKLGFDRQELATLCLRLPGHPLLVKDGVLVANPVQLVAFLDNVARCPIPLDPRVNVSSTHLLGFAGSPARRGRGDHADDEDADDGEEDVDDTDLKPADVDSDRRPRRRR